MAWDVEIKAAVHDCGRLKLGRLSAFAGALIHYERPDEAGPRASDYGLVPTAEPDRLPDVLGGACGIMGVVRKRRTSAWWAVRACTSTRSRGSAASSSWRSRSTRGEPIEGAAAEARRVMAALGIREDQLVSHAYLDLLREAGSPPAR